MASNTSDKVRAGWVRTAISKDQILRIKAASDGMAASVPRKVGGLELTHVSHQFLAYWLEARGGKPMPDAGDIRPRDFAQLLPYMRYLSWEGPERLVYRIFGTALAEVAKIDLTGMNMLDLVEQEHKARSVRGLQWLHEVPCGLLQVRDITDANGLPRACEFLSLPVAPGADGKKRVIGPGMLREKDAPEDFSLVVNQDSVTRLKRLVFIDIGYGIPDDTFVSDEG